MITGSGSTGKAAALEGFRFIGIEQDPAFERSPRPGRRTPSPPILTPPSPSGTLGFHPTTENPPNADKILVHRENHDHPHHRTESR